MVFYENLKDFVINKKLTKQWLQSQMPELSNSTVRKLSKEELFELYLAKPQNTVESTAKELRAGMSVDEVADFLLLTTSGVRKLEKDDLLHPVDAEDFRAYGKSLTKKLYSATEVYAFTPEQIEDWYAKNPRQKYSVHEKKLAALRKQLQKQKSLTTEQVDALTFGKLNSWIDNLIRPKLIGEVEASLSEEKLAQAKKELTDMIKTVVSEKIPSNPADMYPLARAMNRHFIIHVGPTNSGKTYQSLQILAQATSGVYVAPLRLLALEIQEQFWEKGILCSMQTGEEEELIENATIMSCTAEMVNLSIAYDVAVVDECQMLGDRERGYAWTKAILGLPCAQIHLCTAPEAVGLIKRLIKTCKGDTYEIIQHERTTPLVFVPRAFNISTDVERGDAFVVFSRRDAISLAGNLKKQGYTVSMIYGALPYSTRKQQANMFLNRESDVLVATDAIGMGLNLPIRRIVFMDMAKFDGICRRILFPQEILQIAGRAGRQGMYAEGQVLLSRTVFGDRQYVEDCLSGKKRPKELSHAQLDVPDALYQTKYSIDKVLHAWNDPDVLQHLDTTLFRPKFTTDEIERYYCLMRAYVGKKAKAISSQKWKMLLQMPVDVKNTSVEWYWVDNCFNGLEGQKISLPSEASSKDLQALETYNKLLGVYYQLCRRFGQEPIASLQTKKENVSKAIIEILMKADFSEKPNKKRYYYSEDYYDEYWDGNGRYGY